MPRSLSRPLPRLAPGRPRSSHPQAQAVLWRLAWGLAAWALTHPAQARDNDFPTVDRVLYVQECMRAHPGPHYEMVNKCACALDRLAAEVPFEDYVEMSTAFNANSIGGERGNTIRDTEVLQDKIRKYRGLQSKVQKACFLTP